MNEENRDSLRKNIEDVTKKDVATSTEYLLCVEESKTLTQSTYELFSCLYHYASYIIMFVTRLCKDIYQSLLNYLISDNALPEHIVHLMITQKELHKERGLLFTRHSFRTSQDFYQVRCSSKSISLVPENVAGTSTQIYQ